MKIPLSNPDITVQERKAVMDVLEGPNLSLGPKLPEFEAKASELTGRKYAAAVNSGTSGLHLVVRAMGISEGDVVITTPFSFIASANCILFEGAKPLFVDIDKDSLNISPERVSDAVKKQGRRKTKAILAVDVFGHPAEWDALYDISERKGIKLIEDSCEAIGAVYRSPDGSLHRRWPKGKKAGSFGDASVFAFYPNKQITTGEGGLVLTDSKRIYDLCVSMRNQGRDQRAGWLNHVRLGYNYRLSDINCALGIVQLNRLGEILRKRSAVAGMYNSRLEHIEGISTPFCAEHVKMSWFVYVIRLDSRFKRKHRDMIMEMLKKEGISCSAYFSPIHLQPFYRKMFGYRRGDFPVTEAVADRTIALPFYNNLREEEIGFIADNLKHILSRM